MNDEFSKWRNILGKLRIIDRNSHRIYDSILPQILPVLNRLSYKTWCCICPQKEEILQFNDTYFSFTEEPGKYESCPIESITVCLDRLIHIWRTMFVDSFIDEEIATIVSEEHNPKITNILNGKFPQRVSSQLAIDMYRIMYWLFFRVEVRGLSMLIIQDGDDKESALLSFLEGLENVASTPQSQKECIHIEKQFRYAEMITKNPDTGEIDMQMVCDFVEEEYNTQLVQWERLKCAYFQMLNHIFIPLALKKEILAVIQHSAYRRMLQEEYDLRRSYLPQLLPWEINPSAKRTNNILPKDFRTGKKVPGESMNLDLNHSEIVDLFHALQGKYIDKGTDILDFAFSLTGYPVSRSELFKKVIWVHPRKQTLGIFLGLLRPENMEGNRYWSVTPNLFCYQSRKNAFSPSQLSSPYGNQLRHPEARNQDWHDLETIVITHLKRGKK